MKGFRLPVRCINRASARVYGARHLYSQCPTLWQGGRNRKKMFRIDEDGYEKPSSRTPLINETSNRSSFSAVEFVDGTEENISRGGQSPIEAAIELEDDQFVSISRESALYSAYSAKQSLDSRARTNSWSLTRKKNNLSSSLSLFPPSDSVDQTALTDMRRRQRLYEASYSDRLGNEVLSENSQHQGASRSTYGMRRIPMPGLTSYQEVVSAAEEVQMNEELLKALQHPKAAYITTETRYCVNLYEKELGIPGKDTLAFDMKTVSPTLQAVLQRFFCLGLIPSLPNLCQVSEMIGTFAGYPVQERPNGIGEYYGIINLISPTVLHLQHNSCPWFPRLYLSPRSLAVVTDPCLSEFKFGYKQTHQPFHAFEYASRVSKDYRIEVLFATVEPQHIKHLAESVQLTDYAAKRGLSFKGSPKDADASSTANAKPFSEASLPLPTNEFVESTDAWISKLRKELLLDKEGGLTDASPQKSGACTNGLALREEAIKDHRLGKIKALEVSSIDSRSAAKKRLDALKERHRHASRIQSRHSKQRVSTSHSPRVIPGPPT